MPRFGEPFSGGMIGLGEAEPFRRQIIHVRRFHLTAVASRIRETEIPDQYHQEIRAFRRRGRLNHSRASKGEQPDECEKPEGAEHACTARTKKQSSGTGGNHTSGAI